MARLYIRLYAESAPGSHKILRFHNRGIAFYDTSEYLFSPDHTVSGPSISRLAFVSDRRGQPSWTTVAIFGVPGLRGRLSPLGGIQILIGEQLKTPSSAFFIGVYVPCRRRPCPESAVHVR